MPAHRMHLKGPWQYEWSAPPHGPAAQPGEGGPPPGGRLTMPAEWRKTFGDVGGTVRFRRRFHCPTNLEPHEEVWLVFEGVGGTADVQLNDRLLGRIEESQTSAEFSVTPLLAPSNRLVVDLQFDPALHPQQPGGLHAPVALEIRTL